MDDFILRALIGGLILSLIAGPVGALMIWRRMTFFGAAVAHSAVLGVALGLYLGYDPLAATFLTCLLMALALSAIAADRRLSADTVTGVIGHGSLALALVVLAQLEQVRVDLVAYLFGDVLSITWGETAALSLVGLGVFVALLFVWRPLLAITAEPNIAQAEGRPAAALNLVYTLLLAAVVAIGMRLVGALLIIALLVMPAAAARSLSPSPNVMAVLAALVSAASVGAGLFISLETNWPAGPAIALVASAFFLVSLAVRR